MNSEGEGRREKGKGKGERGEGIEKRGREKGEEYRYVYVSSMVLVIHP